jgi:hypothetical protein
MTGKRIARAAVILLLVATSHDLATAQTEPAARLGLSAAPDGYVAEIAPTIGQPFTLYVILTGLEEQEVLSFPLRTVSWVIHTQCCGDSPVGVTELVYGDGVTAVGDPYEEVETTVAGCPDGAAVVLATLTFDWLLEGESEFLLSAGSLTGALDCDGGAHLLRTLPVMVRGRDATPTEHRSWGALKRHFTSDGRGP